jgi:hypothetical protein
LDDGLRKVLRTSAKEITVHTSPSSSTTAAWKFSPATAFSGAFRSKI